MTSELLYTIEQNLRKAAFFKDISDKSRKALAEICIPKNINKKQILFTEGETGHSIYFCVSGNIQLYKTTGEGREIVIKTIKPGEIFAEVILFEESKYPVSALSLAAGQVYVIPKKQIFCLLNNEDFRNDFISMLMKKQRYLANQIKYLTLHDVEERLFLFLKEQYGRQKEIKPSLSKKDIAAAIGTTPESLSRLLMRLKQENKLKWEEKIIKINPTVWQNLD
ncbi:Crp/Fnr family transcriptional regulator [candidate division KSB1 bacterium]|nr:Crp/Fnr family transcriptional regulator [candidate division KSB1 bacterium]